jgi:hypothetical protein
MVMMMGVMMVSTDFAKLATAAENFAGRIVALAVAVLVLALVLVLAEETVAATCHSEETFDKQTWKRYSLLE